MGEGDGVLAAPVGERSEEQAPHTGVTNFKELMAGVRDLTLVIAIFLYFTGFVYQYRFYNSLGVDFSVFDTAPYILLIFAQRPIIDNAWTIVLLAILAGTVIVICRTVIITRTATDTKKRWSLTFGHPAGRGPLTATATALTALSLFLLLGNDAKQRADVTVAAYKSDRNKSDEIRFTLRDPDKYPEPFRRAAGNGSLRLYAESKDTLYLLQWPPTLGRLHVFRVPKADVVAPDLPLPI
jgi:hypothetical protein